mmetsp:Transcript_73903/g.153986  ORF Transcript_73903/g.153986 Transcript_73903/m.153986 type:complete len:170 (-) Transcript_73903:317-826(-)|eukprot:CAMPEP_0206475570 /NCGR_PEP_ID=MMETSP0324_2-20121206/34165_1 /ASSEMBLY_ACC=CAM_ASM_000836 /TAXON_ID=2866 /ORGANISM="Crypthecodinium cohnii, Strain Seligo" /LENGTH=169 /DNA_ID=CAMNT_0053950967 /DNA_START=87 /DNA_END=596 /DNA_ORIENTATION=+
MFGCCNEPVVDKNQEIKAVGASPVMKKQEEIPAEAPAPKVEETKEESPKVKEAPKPAVEAPKKEEPAKEEPKKEDPASPKAPTSGTFEVTIERASKGSKLGMTIGRVDKALKIKAFDAGDVSNFNTKNPGMALKAMDLVVAVNGKTGTANDLLNALASPDALTLKITRA